MAHSSTIVRLLLHVLAMPRRKPSPAAAGEGEGEGAAWAPLTPLQPAAVKYDRGTAVHRLLRRLQSMVRAGLLGLGQAPT